MLGLRLFMHAVRMTANNWQAALQIFALPFSLVVISAIVLGLMTGVDVASVWAGNINAENTDGPVLVALSLFGLAYAVMCTWVAVYWHRYILLGDLPNGFVYQVDWTAIWAYLVKSFVLSMMTLIPVLILVVPITVVLAGAGSSTDFLGPVVGLVVLVVLLRVFIVLPGLAIGRKMTLREGWQAGAGHMPAFLLIAIIELLISNANKAIPNSLVAAVPLLGFVLSLVLGICLLLISVSVLTTLYGYFVEKRAIP